MQHPAATWQHPARTKSDAPVARTHRICDPAYLHRRAHIGLEVNEILLVHRHPMITRVAHQGQSQDQLFGPWPHGSY